MISKRKHTNASINAAIRPLGIVLTDDYKSTSQRAKFRCDCGHQFELRIADALYEGRACPLPSCPVPKQPPESSRRRHGNRSFFAAAEEAGRIERITEKRLDEIVERSFQATKVDRDLIYRIVIITFELVLITKNEYAE